MQEPLDQPLFDDGDLKPALSADLLSLYGQSLVVPGRVNETILDGARRQAARARRMRWTLRWAGGVQSQHRVSRPVACYEQ